MNNMIWTIWYGPYHMVHVNNFLHMKYSRWPVSRLNNIWSISHRKNTSCESVLLLLSIECISIVMITFPFSQHYLYLQNWKFFVVKDSAYCLYKSSRPEMHLFDNGLKTYFNSAHFNRILNNLNFKVTVLESMNIYGHQFTW